MEPFFSNKATGKGTDLGLSISRNIISQLGGRLFLDPHARDTTFIVELPVREHAKSESQESSLN
jgi:C4-dicarboxylate-specific signal transduction histidine kinase